MNHVESRAKVTQFSSLSSKSRSEKDETAQNNINFGFYSFPRASSTKTWWTIKTLKTVSGIHSQVHTWRMWEAKLNRSSPAHLLCIGVIFIRAKHLENPYWLKWSVFYCFISYLRCGYPVGTVGRRKTLEWAKFCSSKLWNKFYWG